jgi:predicted amidohydrolase
MKIGYIQFNPIFGKKKKNIQRIIKFLNCGAKKEADLLVLPELCSTGYVFESKAELRALSEEIPERDTIKNITSFSKENEVYVVAGICERKDDQYFNSAVLIGTQGLISVYRKTHLFGREKVWFSRGDGPFAISNINEARIGLMICFDWIFPEVIRILALKGAQIVCHPANLVLPYCQRALLGAAIQNRVFIVTANRVGIERKKNFTGMSQIINPDMKVLVKSSKSGEEVRVIEVDPKDADSKIITKYNNLWNDRRRELYKDLLTRVK